MLINKDVNNKFLNFIKNINFNFFLLFVFVSSFIWVITKFSNIYKLNNEFAVEWINIPDTISVNNQQKKISILFSASGFEMILYKIFKKNIQISIDRDVLYKENNGIVNIESKISELENQLYEKNIIEDVISKKISFNYSVLARKKVPVLLDKKISFRPGYLNENDFFLFPDSVFVTGPIKNIDTLNYVITEKFIKKDIYKSVDEEIKLLFINNVKYSTNQIKLSSIVKRYSEKEFKIPVKIINLPDSIKLKIFPNYIKLKAVVSLDNYNDILEDDFVITADYKFLNKKFSSLSLFLVEYPIKVKNVNWQPKTVNYLIRK